MMKSQSLICSAAIASAMLAATAIPSRAATIVDVVETPLTGAVNFTYDITLSAASTLTVNGFEANIGDFVAALSTQGGSLITSASQMPSSPPFFFMLGPEMLAAGTYVLSVTGTDAPPGGFGVKVSDTSNTISLTPTPIPGTLVLFVSGLGLLGFWGWNKGRKAGSDSGSLEAVAC